MKPLCNVGAVASLVFVAVALFNLRSVAHFRIDVAICIWAFVSALGLSFGLYVFYLRQRITALEKRLVDRE